MRPTSQQAWLDIDWGEVGVEPPARTSAARRSSVADDPAVAPHWPDPHAATVADALLQRPFRGYWRGDALKMP